MMSEDNTIFPSAELPLREAMALVRQLLAEQAEVVLSGWSGVKPLHYKDRRDFATAVDIAVEQNLKRAIQQRFPGHGFQGEESKAENSSSPYQWVIDPIDGTKYYAGQAHLFSTSVGLLYQASPILGVVQVPCSGQCFHAMVGQGAFLGALRLQGSTASDLGTAIINVDMPGAHALAPNERSWFESKLVALTRRAYRVRSLGVGALASCWLASGALDAYVDLTGHTKPQDLAAGRIIMAESGAKVDYLTPTVGPPRLIAAPPRLWDALALLIA